MAIDFDAIAKKKFLNIPVLYWVGGFVLILAVVAYRMKPSVEPTSATDAAGTGVDTDGAVDESNPYGGLATNGTVIVAPQQPQASDAVAETNDTWARAAVNYLIESKQATPGAAQAAIQKYLQGDNLTFEEGILRDSAIAKLTLPPEPLVNIGQVSEKPGQKQFSNFPGTHTVKGTNDNTPAKLATIYYGSGDALHQNKIVAANTSLGPASTTYNVGNRIHIPLWITPKYFTAHAGFLTDYQIARANGIAAINVLNLNPGMSFPVVSGAKVRVG